MTEAERIVALIASLPTSLVSDRAKRHLARVILQGANQCGVEGCGTILVDQGTWKTMTDHEKRDLSANRGGYCRKHYHRLQRYGDPSFEPPKRPRRSRESTLEDWVWLRDAGLTVAEAADRMNMTEPALQTALRRARRRDDPRGDIK